jgi:hypothetical protein
VKGEGWGDTVRSFVVLPSMASAVSPLASAGG